MLGRKMIGTGARLQNSRVICAGSQPGSMNPAVTCTSSPKRARELFPSSRPTSPLGTPTLSSVAPSANWPGSSKVPCSEMLTSDISTGMLGSITAVLLLSKIKSLLSRCKSTLAGCTSAGLNGSITIDCCDIRLSNVLSERIIVESYCIR